MTPEKVLDLGVKFGVVPFMFYQIFVLNGKLDKVEERLYDCYEDRLVTAHDRPTDPFFEMISKQVAILPCDEIRSSKNTRKPKA